MAHAGLIPLTLISLSAALAAEIPDLKVYATVLTAKKQLRKPRQLLPTLNQVIWAWNWFRIRRAAWSCRKWPWVPLHNWQEFALTIYCLN